MWEFAELEFYELITESIRANWPITIIARVIISLPAHHDFACFQQLRLIGHALRKLANLSCDVVLLADDFIATARTRRKQLLSNYCITEDFT